MNPLGLALGFAALWLVAALGLVIIICALVRATRLPVTAKAARPSSGAVVRESAVVVFLFLLGAMLFYYGISSSYFAILR